MFIINKLFLWLAAAGCALCVSSSAVADPFLPVPPASFLNYHVSTARGLSEEVAQDVVVRARLARHFGMSAPQVAEYVRQNLVETRLTASQAGSYRVACISPSGREYFVSERLAAGTPVFALASTGQPILRLACGNPLVAALPPVHHTPIVKVRPAALSLSKTPPVAVAIPMPEITDQSFTTEVPIEAPLAAPVVQVEGVTESLHGGKSGLFLPVLFGFIGTGVLVHHGSTPPAAPPVVPPVAPVPEANTLTLFCVFGLVLLTVKARTRRKN